MPDNPFSVQQMGDITPGLAGLGSLLQQRRDVQQQQATAQRGAELYRTGTPEDIAEFSISNPEVGKRIEQQIGFRDESTKQNFYDTSRKILSDPANTEKYLQERFKFVADVGGDPTMTMQELEHYRRDPEGYGEKVEKAYSMLDPVGYKSYRTATRADAAIEPKDKYKVVGGRLVDITGAQPKVVIDDVESDTPKTLLDMGLTKVGDALIDISDPEQPKEVWSETPGGAELATVLNFRKQVNTNPIVKDFLAIDTQSKRLDETINDVQSQIDSGKQPNYIAVDQTLITTMNKMLDPTSVVRESEYARTSSDQALWSNIKGKADKLRAGGAGLTDDERNAMVRMARRFASVSRKKMQPEIDSFKKLSKKYKIDFNDIISPTLLDVQEEASTIFGGTPLEAQGLPEGVTEEDITETMRANNMTRDQVLTRLRGQ